jgi:hypothetical protein
MNKQELIEQIKGLKNLFGNKAEYIEIDAAIKLIEQLDEPQKVQVPQFVADWYEANKDDFETNLFRAVDLIPSDYEEGDLSEFEEWLVDDHTEPFQTLVNMHQFGYEVKKERRYTVKMRTTKQPLFYNSLEKRLFFSLGKLATQFTFKQLEEAGFREVFNSPLFEVEEVEG